jgi:hypothetical protein
MILARPYRVNQVFDFISAELSSAVYCGAFFIPCSRLKTTFPPKYCSLAKTGICNFSYFDQYGQRQLNPNLTINHAKRGKKIILQSITAAPSS